MNLRRLLLIAVPVLAGWFVAAGAIWAGWSASLEARHVDGIRLRADLLATRQDACPDLPGTPCRLDPAQVVELSDEGRYDIEILDSSRAALPGSAEVARRFLAEKNAECLLAERMIPGGRVLRVSLPSYRIGTRNPLVWGVATGSVALGSLLPLLMLTWLLRTERSRISHLVEIANAAERGQRPPPTPRALFGDLAETAGQARGLGAEIRHLRLRSRLEDRRLQRFAEALSEGLLVLDDQSRILLCNTSAWTLLGFGDRLGKTIPRHARGRSVFNLCTRLEFLDDLREALRRERDAEFDLLAAGRTWRARLSRAPLGEGRWGLVVALSDITAAREAEVLQARLVSDVSHEFKTPLTAIRGYAETLLDEMDPGEEAAFQRRSLQRILAGTDHLEEVVQDLLDLGQMRETGGRLHREDLDLREVLRQAAAAVEPLATQRGVPIALELPDTTAPLPGDRGRLSRAIMNLLSNALKYGSSGGSIRARLVEAEQTWHVEVIDRGPGIPPDALPHLFERFFRVDHGRSKDAGGTGLGLAIVREVARAHDGEAEVESQLGKGSTFRLVLPRPKDFQLPHSGDSRLPD